MNEDSRNQGARTRPTGETIVPRLLDAVERLCTERSPHTVRMQDVAVEAGLSAGVAYRYFGSKARLFGAALDRMAERVAAAATSSDDPQEAFGSLLRVFDAHPAFIRIGTSALLDGQNLTEMMSGHPAARDLVAQAQARGDPDPRTLAAVILTIGLGTALYGATVNRAFERPDDDERLSRAIGRMVAAWVANPAERSIPVDEPMARRD